MARDLPLSTDIPLSLYWIPNELRSMPSKSCPLNLQLSRGHWESDQRGEASITLPYRNLIYTITVRRGLQTRLHYRWHSCWCYPPLAPEIATSDRDVECGSRLERQLACAHDNLNVSPIDKYGIIKIRFENYRVYVWESVFPQSMRVITGSSEIGEWLPFYMVYFKVFVPFYTVASIIGIS